MTIPQKLHDEPKKRLSKEIEKKRLLVFFFLIPKIIAEAVSQRVVEHNSKEIIKVVLKKYPKKTQNIQ